jgi:hypothetical protein
MPQDFPFLVQVDRNKGVYGQGAAAGHPQGQLDTDRGEPQEGAPGEMSSSSSGNARD